MRPLESAVWIGFVFAFGAIIGSFLNVVIHRLPLGESIVHPRSRCPHCGKGIPGWANVPLLSYVALRGCCMHCRGRISARYPLVEALTGLLFVAGWFWGQSGARVGLDWALFAALVAVTFIDLDHQIIPDAITLPGIGLGLLVALLWPPAGGPLELGYVLDAALGAAVGGGMLWAIAFLYERRTGQIGLGLGDVKLVAMLGAFLGLQPILGVILLGSLLGIAHALVVIGLRGGGRKTKIPFGPALALAGVLHVLRPELISSLMPRL